MSFGSFWKTVGKGLAQVGVGVIKVAEWASTHPEVIQIIASAVKKDDLVAPLVIKQVESGDFH